MIRIANFIIALLLVVSQAPGQQADSARNTKNPGVAVKFSVLHLVAFYPTLQMALEHRLYKNISIQYDGGVVLDYAENDSEQYSDKRGYKLKGELRYYAHPANFTDLYLATEVFYNHVDFDRTSVFGIDCAGECDYFQYKTFRVQYRERGYSFKVGFLYYFDQKEHFFIDFNGGISLRNIHYDYVGKPTGNDVIEHGDDNYSFGTPYEESRRAYGLVVGYRIGYRFR